MEIPIKLPCFTWFYICIYIIIYIYIYVCIYIYIYYTYVMYVYIECTYIYIYTHTYVFVYTYIYIYIHTYVEDFPSGVYYCSFSGMYFWAHHCFDVLSGGFLGIMVALCVLLGAGQLDSTQPVASEGSTYKSMIVIILAGVGIGICWEILT